MQTRATAERILTSIIDAVRQPTIQAYMTVEVESEREAFGVLGGILAGFVGKLAVGGTGGGNGSGGERQEGMQLEESMEEKLMRVFIRHLINENIKLSETNTQKHQIRAAGQYSSLSLLSQRSKLPLSPKPSDPSQAQVMKALNRLTKLQSYLISPKQRHRSPQIQKLSAPKEFYVEENKYLKQMQEIMRGRLEVLEGGEGDRRRKEETVNRMDGGMMKRERVVNCKDSQIIRRQLLRS